MSCRSSRSLVLASRSPRRQELLRAAGVSFNLAHPRVKEGTIRGESPSEMVRRLALAKALDVAPHVRPAWVLAADTAVVLEGEILGKPCDQAEARLMLSRLLGREHEVLTGFALVGPEGETKHVQAVSTRVRLRRASEREIRDYVRTGEPLDKAGAYAIQGLGGCLVASVSGSYTNVIGLPLESVLELLREFGLYSYDVA